MPVDISLQWVLLRNDECLSTICANTCAVVKEGSLFALIDSHTNRNLIQKQPKECFASLYNYVVELAKLLGVRTQWFEINGNKMVVFPFHFTVMF